MVDQIRRSTNILIGKFQVSTLENSRPWTFGFGAYLTQQYKVLSLPP
jgi:hypothetical protein